MSRTQKKLLYIGLAHGASDSRLCHYLARGVRERFPEVSCFYLGRQSGDPAAFSNDVWTVLPMPGGITPRKRRFRFDDAEKVARFVVTEGFDLVQVSDVRELKIGLAIKRIADVPVIFDAHEDYFNQKYEYGGKTPASFLKGVAARLSEVAMVRFMDAVFCTDDFIRDLYALPVMGGKAATTIRNVPPESMIRDRAIVREIDELKLVYIGSVNAVRGVIDTARFVARFNEAHPEPGLSFHVFSRETPLVLELRDQGLITYHGFLQYRDVPTTMQQFDVGVSLIQPTKKFARNIPIKNFEYMALGLPILTSDYGQMKKWVEAADAGLTIDPTDYQAFEQAIFAFRDVRLRARLGANGVAYAKAHLIRSIEASPYFETVGRLLGR